MVKELSKKEIRAIERLRKAFDALPKTLLVYVLDDTVVLCKIGSPANLGSDIIVSGVIATNMLEDVHDDMDFGRKP